MDLSAKLMMVLHGMAAIVLIGSTTHNAILSVLHLRGQTRRPRLQRLYARVLCWAYLVTFVLGLIIYPPFRLDVRAAYLDEHVPLATAAFEVKEHWLGIGLVVLACFWPLSKTLDYRKRTPDATLFHMLSIALALIVWVAMLTGLVIVSIKPLGG